MVDVKSIFITFSVVVTILLFTGIALYYIGRAIGKKKPSMAPLFPSDEYMNYIGARCPSGWVYKGSVKRGNKYFDVCQNTFDVPVNQSGASAYKCYDGDPAQKIKVFPRIKDYRSFIKKNISRGERCQWVNHCGPPPNVDLPEGVSPSDITAPPAAWVGISDHC